MIKMKSFLNRSKRINNNNSKTTKNKAQEKFQDKMNENKENIDATECMIDEQEACGTDVDTTTSNTKKTNHSLKNTKETSKEKLECDLINKKLPKELLIRVFSYLDIISLCRCAQVSKV